MNDKTINILLKKRDKMVKQIPINKEIIKGSLVELKITCGKFNCHCYKGEKHAALYISKSHKGKTQMTYIPKKCKKEIREYVRRYKKLIKAINALSDINIKIIKIRG